MEWGFRSGFWLVERVKSFRFREMKVQVSPKFAWLFHNVFTILAWIFVVLGAVAGYYGFSIVAAEKDGFSLANIASFGSYLQGAVGSLWALAALLFIYETLRAQKRQLQQQDDELERQKKEFQIQENSIKRQSFENSFFQLLNLQNATAAEFHVTISGTAHQGRTCFQPLFRAFEKQFSTDLQLKKLHGAPQSVEQKRTFAIEEYFKFCGPYQASLGHYFRNLYHMIKLAKADGFTYEEQRRYTSLARAQLSAFELALLFYSSITPLGEKFKPLIEEFGLLENLEQTLLLDEDHVRFYHSDAYE
ncbi:MAG: hypothetical protein JWM68_3213 [Verrucomicrobiales bacterium]|nr:hypothetical protein [Verrucomicrobiales bacterium]